MKCEHVNVNTYKFHLSGCDIVSMLQDRGYNVPLGSVVKINAHSGNDHIRFQPNDKFVLEVESVNNSTLEAGLCTITHP